MGKHTVLDKERLEEAYKRLISPALVAVEFGCSVDKIRIWLKKYKLYKTFNHRKYNCNDNFFF
jgi:hypothetical protein